MTSFSGFFCFVLFFFFFFLCESWLTNLLKWLHSLVEWTISVFLLVDLKTVRVSRTYIIGLEIFNGMMYNLKKKYSFSKKKKRKKKRIIKKYYIHNIFTINLKWQIIIGCYVCVKKLFKLWIKIRTNNNLWSTGAFRDSGAGAGAGLGNFWKRWVRVRQDSAIKKLLKIFLQYLFNILLSILLVFHII